MLVICHLSFVICPLSFVICPLVTSHKGQVTRDKGQGTIVTDSTEFDYQSNSEKHYQSAEFPENPHNQAQFCKF